MPNCVIQIMAQNRDGIIPSHKERYRFRTGDIIVLVRPQTIGGGCNDKNYLIHLRNVPVPLVIAQLSPREQIQYLSIRMTRQHHSIDETVATLTPGTDSFDYPEQMVAKRRYVFDFRLLPDISKATLFSTRELGMTWGQAKPMIRRRVFAERTLGREIEDNDLLSSVDT